MNMLYYSIIYKAYDSKGKVISSSHDNFANIEIAKKYFDNYKSKGCSATLYAVLERELPDNGMECLNLIIDHKDN